MWSQPGARRGQNDTAPRLTHYLHPNPEVLFSIHPDLKVAATQNHVENHSVIFQYVDRHPAMVTPAKFAYISASFRVEKNPAIWSTDSDDI
jgi:hypothetical protein